MALQLELAKAGDAPKAKLQLKLSKPSRFTVEAYWESEHDLDLHALLATNSGGGAKVSDMAQVLSTYNPGLPLSDGSSATRQSGDKRPFKTPDGALYHSGDARTGVNAAVDEIITVDGAAVPNGVNEIPIFITLHPATAGTFSAVKMAGIRIKDDSGNVLGEYELTNQYGQFNAVQMGSLVIGPNGWEYTAVGSGFMGDFNTVLEYFS